MSGQPKPELLEIPGAEGASVDFLTNLLEQPAPVQDVPQLQVGPAQQIPQLQVGPAQQIPLQQVAGLGATEQTVQNLLTKFLGTSATGGEAYKLGMGELSKTLGGEFYDPRTSDFWKGYREVSEMEEEKGVAAIRRRGQLGGGLFATPGQRIEKEYVREKGAERTMRLGGLYETERARKFGAVEKALGFAGLEEAGKAGRIELGARVGAIPRQVKNLQYQAAYGQAMGQSKADFARQQLQNQATYAKQAGQSEADFAQQQLQNQATYQQQFGQSQADLAQQMFPYQYQAPVAAGLMPQWYVPGQDNTAVGMLGLLGSIIGGK